MREVTFYRCAHCGNIAYKPYDAGVPLICCGEKMEALVPNTVDAAKEKHVPVIDKSSNIVTISVGSVKHPMTPEHYIGFIAASSGAEIKFKLLKPGDKPSMRLHCNEDVGDAVIAYAWCNLHGLWMAN